MAEGGEDPNENPFSFHNFNKKKRTSPSDTLAGTSSDEREDGFEMPDVQNIGGNEEERSRRPAAADDDRHRRKDDNPFSFKKFLKSSRPKTNTGALANLDLANDLPDFIQDHSTSPASGSAGRPRIPPSDVPLPDFALDSSASSNVNAAAVAGLDVNGVPDLDIDNQMPPPGMDLQGPLDFNDHGLRQPRAFGFMSNSPPDLAANGHMSHSEPEEDDPDEILAIPQANATGGLPDFLSDSAVNSVDMRSMDNPMAVSDDFLYHANGDHELEMRRLREENRELREQLHDAREHAETQSRRVAAIQREMETVQKREAADTAALENMVMQVEANLTATTQRAVQAETTISKLKQEIRSLKMQLQGVAGQPNAGAPNDVVKEKAKYAAEQISTAARNAEQTLQQLLNGVETLKLVSSVLSSIDKVTDAGADGDTDEAPNGATGGGGAAV